MKKFLIASLVAIAPVIASAQVQLISGFNFGQFLYAGEPVTNFGGGSYPTTGSVTSNFGGLISPGPTDGGVYKGANGIDGFFSAGSSALYFDGSNGSNVFDGFGGGAPGSVTVNELGIGSSVNAQTIVPAINMNGLGDNNNASLRFVNSGSLINQFSIVTNTSLFADYVPGVATEQVNFSFAAFATSSTGSVQFKLDGVDVGSAFIINPGIFQRFTLDLPTSFYGDVDATLVAVVNGDLNFDNFQINGNLAAIPEPSTYAAILGACTMGFVALRRRRNAASQVV